MLLALVRSAHGQASAGRSVLVSGAGGTIGSELCRQLLSCRPSCLVLFELSEKINQDYLYIFINHTLWDNAFAENVRGVCAHTAPSGATMRCSTNGRTWHSNVWLAE